MIEGYLTVNDLAEKWGIEGATKFGRSWAIPADTEKPTDGRETTGQYKNWRKKVREEG